MENVLCQVLESANLDAIDRHEPAHFMGVKRKPELYLQCILCCRWSKAQRCRKQEGRRRNWRPARRKLGITRLCCSLVTMGFVQPNVLSFSLVFCLRNLTIHSEVVLHAVHIHKYSSEAKHIVICSSYQEMGIQHGPK